MLMVIFGAGASHDSSPDKPAATIESRPPLANDLFVDLDLYRSCRDKFPQFHDLIGELIPKAGRSVEEAMQRLQDEATRIKGRQQQLTAIRYYLQCLFKLITPKCLDRIGGITVTNHHALLGQIEDNRSTDPIILVTFNYDTLLELALEKRGLSFTVIADYVSGSSFKLFKLHGSTNWGRTLDGPVPTEISAGSSGGPWERADKMIRHAGTYNISTQYIVTESQAPYSGNPLYPAIAVPVVSKEVFECPPDHVRLLAELIPKVTRILTIGWRGSEQHFLRMLKNLGGAIDIVTVARTDAEANEPLEQIRAQSVAISSSQRFGGFSSTVGDRQLDGLLARRRPS